MCVCIYMCIYMCVCICVCIFLFSNITDLTLVVVSIEIHPQREVDCAQGFISK